MVFNVLTNIAQLMRKDTHVSSSPQIYMKMWKINSRKNSLSILWGLAFYNGSQMLQQKYETEIWHLKNEENKKGKEF